MVLLGNVCQVEACFDPFRDCVSLGAREVYGLRRKYLKHVNHFCHTQSYSYVTLVKRKLVSVCLEIVLISVQHRYTYVLNVPWAWKSFWARPMVLGVVSLVEARVGPFGGSFRLSAR